MIDFVLVVFFVFTIQIFLFKDNAKKIPLVFFLTIYHFLFSIIFLSFEEGSITDSQNYYSWGLDGLWDSNLGTGFVVQIIYYLSRLGFADYYDFFLVFSGFSAIGISLIYISLNEYIKKIQFNKKINFIFSLSVFIPSFHFWTVAVGKDSLMVFFYGLLISSILKYKSLVVGVVSALAIFMIRPHVGICVLLMFFLYFYIYGFGRGYSSANEKLGLRFFLVILFFVFSAISYSILLGFVQKYSTSGFENLSDFASSRGDVYAETGSGFSVDSVPYIGRFILMFLGGIPWSSLGILQIAAMFEGIILIYFTIKSYTTLRKIKINYKLESDILISYRFTVFIFLYAILVAAILAYNSTNLGLMVRQRVMIYIPIFVSFVMARMILLSLISNTQSGLYKYQKKSR